MTVSLEEALPALLLILDAAIILLCLIYRRLVKKLCIVALCCNALALLVTLSFLAFILYSMQTSSEAGLALAFGLAIQLPPLVALAALAAIYRWRMRPGPSGSPTVTEGLHH
jgi:hypothetical protein